MKKLLKWLMFWKKDTSREQRQLELEKLFMKSMTDLVNTINRTYTSQVKVENTVTSSLTQHSESVSEIMQSFQEKLEELEGQFESFFHRENRQSRILQKDINHIGTRIELVSSTMEDMRKTLNRIPLDPFNARDIDPISESPLIEQHEEKNTSKVNPPKFYKKRGRLSYREIKIIDEINGYLHILGNDAPPLYIITDEINLGNLRRDLKNYINKQYQRK